MSQSMIMVVEDDPPVQNLLGSMLESQSYTWKLAATGNDAILEAGCSRPDLILMDLGLPDMDGIDVITRIRSWSTVPILVLSARMDERDKIAALDAGADDYITKPFSVPEMLARIRAMQRRFAMNKTQESSSLYQNQGLTIDFAGESVCINGNPLHLTPIEYKLLCLLAQNTGKVLTSKYITMEIWGTTWDSDLASLRVYMAMLRKKLKAHDHASLIETRIGVGYKMVRPDEEQV